MSNIKTIANIITTSLLAHSTKLSRDVSTLIPKNAIVDLAKYFDANQINNQGVNKAIEMLIDEPQTSVEDVLKNHNLLQITDTKALTQIVENVIADNPAQVEQYKSGKIQVIGFLVGQCMKKSAGTGNPKIFNNLIAKALM